MKKIIKALLKSATGKLIISLIVSMVFKKIDDQMVKRFNGRHDIYIDTAREIVKAVEKEVQDEINPDDL